MKGPQAPVGADMERKRALHARYPTALDLRARARRRMPNFAFEYMDGGAGAGGGVDRNWSALDHVELVPRYGLVAKPPAVTGELFGSVFSAPIGISPIGGPGTAFPGAETYLAKAAQAARVPYTLGVLSGVTVEQAAEMAPDVLWFQLYRFANNEHKIGLDLTRRAAAAGVRVLVLTIDTPIRTTRPREVKSGIANPFKLNMRLRMDALSSPAWLTSLARNGIPRFASLTPYMPPNTNLDESAAFIRRESGGAFTWDEIAKYRELWRGPLVLKGVLHPEDAERAVAMGIDGLFVTNHGGRQIEGLPSSIDVLPAIASAVGGKCALILDSGVRSGLDAARAVSLGADAAFVGKAFLWSLGALGPEGPAHLIDLLTEEFRSTMGQLGCKTIAELRSVPNRHPGKWTREEFARP
ncbi:MAG: alpha-hydroxyacid dehydrogenase, FMN-dependent L-lactate dehydrogenase [Hyphomicrobiales bacterium]|nr:alpha-hydroxyacid dehydrogenase, FMN-dependent L-lactate dehydrogenase [Hyphomicrobiales bacterium]